MQKEYTIIVGNQTYAVRQLAISDGCTSDYFRLRGSTFVEQLGWNLPVDEEGRERDHYDGKQGVSIYGVFGKSSEEEYLLGGGRVFELHTWEDSMIPNEFRTMISEEALCQLQAFDCTNTLEFNRICVRRGRWFSPPDVSLSFNLLPVTDLIYSAVYRQAEESKRKYVVGIVDTFYYRILKRSLFDVKEVYSRNLDGGQGYAVVIIDLRATISSLRSAGKHEKAKRLLALCSSKDW